jgi:hypothetical protein
MPEMQKPVLEHAAPKANQTPRLDGRLADNSVPDSNDVTVRETDDWLPPEPVSVPTDCDVPKAPNGGCSYWLSSGVRQQLSERLVGN